VLFAEDVSLIRCPSTFLKEDHDERTETALEEMMEKFKW